jgi:signal transduction histidine kinase
MFSGIRPRLIALLSLVILIFFIGVLFVGRADEAQLQVLVRHVKQSRSDTFDRIVLLTGESLEALAYDYSYWDDMVKLAERGNLEFAKQNLDGALGTYKVDRLWVYRLNGTVAYQIMRGPSGQAVPAVGSLLSPAMIHAALGGDKRFCHFFLTSGDDLIEIRGATLHPTADQARRTPPRGYFFVGRVWNDALLGRLASLSATAVRIERPRADGQFEPLPKDAVDTVHFSQAFPELDGKPAFRLAVTSQLDFLRQFDDSTATRLRLEVAFVVAFLVVISMLINAWVTSPLNAVSKALDEHEPRHLDRMLSTRNEFGRLARLVRHSFDQEETLAAAMNMKSEFTSMVSHELRTPLSVITESIALVHEGLAGPISAEQQDFLDTAKRNAERLNRIINDVLDYQKLESHRMELHVTESDINVLVGENARGFELLARTKGLSLVARLRPSLPLLRIDPDKITQVLANLLSNALKFTERGAITVETGLTADGLVRVAVTDEGIGIADEDIPKLFQSFSQISSGTGRKVGGTGFLAIQADHRATRRPDGVESCLAALDG